jgi:adenine/guanine phosphoribosyltransferase-like PRPP-binding protein
VPKRGLTLASQVANHLRIGVISKRQTGGGHDG